MLSSRTSLFGRLGAVVCATRHAPTASAASRGAARPLPSSPTGVRLAVVAALAAGILAVPAVASADTFCVHNPTGCTGSTKPDLKTALAAAAANGVGKDTIRLGAGSFTEGPAAAGAGNPVEIVGASAQDTTLLGAGDNITVLTLLDAASTVSDLGVKVTGTGVETGLRLAGTGSHLKVTNTGAQAGSLGVVFAGASPRLQASSVALSHGPNQMAYAVYSDAGHATVADSELSAMRGIYQFGGQLDVVRSRVWAQQGMTASSDAHATASDSTFRAPGPSPSIYPAYALTASGDGSNVIDADRVTALGSGTADVGVSASPFAQAGSHATIHIRGSVIDGFGKALRAHQAGGSSSTITTAWSAYKASSTLVTGGATYTPAASNLDLTGLDAGFVNAAGGDLWLRHDSPLVDLGDPAFQAPGVLDRDGRERPRDGDGAGGPRVDIGALEYQRSAPVAAPTATPATVEPGQMVTFDGNASDADPGETPTYHWAFDDGTTATGATVQHAFTSTGPHTAKLTVSDPAALTGAAEVTVTVNAPAGPAPNPPPLTPAADSTPAPAPGPATTPSFTGVRLVSTRLTTAGRFITLKLSCPAATAGRCTGQTKLSARRHPTGSRPAATVSMGRARFSIAAGKQARVRLRVARSGRMLLHRTPRLRGRATTAARDSAGRSKTTVAKVSIRRRQR
jgi:PKD repeat protein